MQQIFLPATSTLPHFQAVAVEEWAAMVEELGDVTRGTEPDSKAGGYEVAMILIGWEVSQVWQLPTD